MTSWFADSSALVKLIAAEAETPAMQEAVRESDLAASALVLTELPRALAARADESLWAEPLRRLLDRVRLVELDAPLLARAGKIAPPGLRSLDAIHLVSALSIADALDGVLVYDRRLAAACLEHGLHVVAPGAAS